MTAAPRKFKKGDRVRFVKPGAYYGAEAVIDQATGPTRFRAFMVEGRQFGFTASQDDFEALT